MPIVPQYRAEGPAQPLAPELESIQGPRVDASTALRGLAQLQGAVQGVAQPLPNAPEDLGQGAMRGLAAVGQGVQNVGQVAFDVEQRIAEAWSFRKLSEAQDVMDREVADFESWKLKEQNPNKWTTEWNSRFERVKGQILSGDDLSPAAKDAINQRVITFGTRHGYGVQLDAQKRVVGMAAESLEAEIIRATKAGDLSSVEMLAGEGVRNGWIREDQAERLKWRAQDEIETKSIDDSMNRSRAYAMMGQLPEAMAELDNPLIPESERMVLKAEMENVTAAKIETGQALDMAAEQGEVNVARMLEEKDEAGNPKNFSRIRGADRQNLISELWGQHYAQKRSIAAVVGEGIDNGSFQSMDEVLGQFEGFELSEVERKTLEDKFKGQFLKDESYAQSVFTSAAAYDPASDPTGERAESLASEWSIVLAGDPRLEKALGVLEKRRSGQSLTMPENMRAAKTKELLAVREAESSYKIPVERIKPATTKEGVPIYVDTGADIKPGDPGYFETGEGYFDGSHIKGKRIELSQDDRIKVSEGKGIIEDLAEKNRRAAEDAKILDALEQDADAGKIQDEVQWDDRYGALAMPIKDKAAASTIDGSLFPQSEPAFMGPAPATDRIEVIKQRAAQLKGSTTF